MLTQEEIDLLNAEIAALETAVAQQETRVRAASGAEVQYRSVAEMIRALEYKRAQLAETLGTAPRPFRVSYIAHGGRGFD